VVVTTEPSTAAMGDDSPAWMKVTTVVVVKMELLCVWYLLRTTYNLPCISRTIACVCVCVVVVVQCISKTSPSFHCAMLAVVVESTTGSSCFVLASDVHIHTHTSHPIHIGRYICCNFSNTLVPARSNPWPWLGRPKT
jgi:hypothetical protein